MTTTTIGAKATIQWKDEDTVQMVYISLGTWHDDDETDSFGVRDDEVFFYCEGIEELEELSDPNNAEDFVILDYSLVHKLELEDF